jgi:hypothetical protein
VPDLEGAAGRNGFLFTRVPIASFGMPSVPCKAEVYGDLYSICRGWSLLLDKSVCAVIDSFESGLRQTRLWSLAGAHDLRGGDQWALEWWSGAMEVPHVAHMQEWRSCGQKWECARTESSSNEVVVDVESSLELRLKVAC